MSKTKATTKLGGDQKRKAERKAAKAEAKANANGNGNGDGDIKMAEVEVKEERRKEKKQKKEMKESKEEKSKRKAQKVEGEEEEEGGGKTDAQSDSGSEKATKKRKRSSDGDLEIDITAPKPPSKKTLRKLKKHPELAKKLIKKSASSDPSKEEFPEHSSQARSKWGVWIGNLPFSTTPAILGDFFGGERSSIEKDQITRINLPTDSSGRNKGFAYVDFKSEEALEHALTLTESLVGGRRVLIKNSKDFSKRPPPVADNAPKTGANISKNPPSRILYVGNLEFSLTAEHLREHFSFAGKIVKVRLATFEDTGKCKGFGFVDFEDKESVKRAMLGLTPEEEQVYEDLEGKAELELHTKRRKRAILGARPITMEYGQDSSVRYKKRFGGKDKEGDDSENPRARSSDGFEKKPWKDNRSADAGAAYSSDVRRTGAITAGEGKKMTFDE